jgi:hypothetical protein
MNAQEVVAKAPKDTISVAKAKQLSKNWQQNNPIEIDSTIEVEGSRKKIQSVYWSLDVVEDYLAYAKKKSDTLGYTMTGLRVYFANYGKNPNPVKKNRNTLFIVPTGPKNTSKASSLNIMLPPTDNDIPTPPLNAGTGGQGGYPQ